MALNVAPLARGSSRRRSIGTSLSEINVTPFVDVMLVLLVIFMVTAPLMQSGIGINLPQAESESAPADEGLTLTVTKDKFIHIGETVVNIHLLERRLNEFFYGKKKRVLFLQGDQDIPYGFVIDILDIAKNAGVEVVGLITEPEEKTAKRR